MATFLDIFNKKTAIQKQASDAEFAYEETKLQDTLAKQKRLGRCSKNGCKRRQNGRRSISNSKS